MSNGWARIIPCNELIMIVNEIKIDFYVDYVSEYHFYAYCCCMVLHQNIFSYASKVFLHVLTCNGTCVDTNTFFGAGG